MFSIIQNLDDKVLFFAVSTRSGLLTQMMRILSTFGEWYILLPSAALIVFLFARSGWYFEAKELAYSVIGTSLVVVLLKNIVQRPRPPMALRLVYEPGYSFPSWHAAISIAFWGYLSFLAMRRTKSAALKSTLATLTLVLIALISLGRIYLGVHYLSDVLAGVAIGVAALWLSITYTKFTRRKLIRVRS